MKTLVRRMARPVFDQVAHFVGRVSGRFYFEDYVRVYPGAVAYNRLGFHRAAGAADIRNYLNHRKFYDFVSQFVRGTDVADVGCGSGYGCEIIRRHGARTVAGCDLSRNAIRFARTSFGSFAEFTEQGITDLRGFADASFDVTASSEVLEHIKEYRMEDKALSELKRVTRCGGLVVVGTPNSELMGEHGFYFAEIQSLFGRHFDKFCIFENALVPFGEHKRTWQRRREAGETGVVVTEQINFAETPFWQDGTPELKSGLAPGSYRFADREIDTTLLHNPYSWIIVAAR